MPESLDDVMSRASLALVQMDYLTCETLCLSALALARASDDWVYYARILLPLQEARRQRRMIAAESVVRLGTAGLTETPADHWIAQVQAGCVALTHPHTPSDALSLHEAARRGRLHIEVLFAESSPDAPTWTLRSFRGPAVSCPFAAPPEPWRNQWLAARDVPPVPASDDAIKASASPSDWFLDACEALGDAALQGVPADAPVEVLEPLLDVAPDHEILHQRLAAAARARARRAALSTTPGR